MPRVKRSVHARKKRRKVLSQAKGYWGLKKSSYRRLWIIRINAAARQNGLSYNQLMAGLRRAEIPLDRKVLAELAVSDPQAFGAIAEQAKSALEAQAKA